MATQTKAPQPRATATKQKAPSLASIRQGQSNGMNSMASFIPEKWRDTVAIVGILVALLFFFRGVLDSTHTFNAGDNVAFDALRPFLDQAKAQGYSMPQWIPNIFCGMPAFSALVITGARVYDLVHEIFTAIQNAAASLSPNQDAMVHIWHYFIFGIGMYLLMRVTRNASRLVSFFAAFSAVFSTWIITYIMIGHNTKIYAIMAMPYIFMGIEKLRTPKLSWQATVFWCAVLAAAFHLLLESIHMQMIFYIFLAVLIYYVTSLVLELTRKSDQPKSHTIIPLVRSGVLALVMAGIAFAMSADRYMASLAYEPYSIRGQAPIQDVQNQAAENKMSVSHATTSSGGLDWGYATAWSFSPREVITFIIPGWYGFGKMHLEGEDPDAREMTYWGQMGNTDAANYTGIVVLMLGLVGIFALWKRDRLVPPLAIITIFAILLSFGGNWPILFRPMFNFFPSFNKFRAPMMALVLMQLAFPILAALMFQEIIRVWKLHDSKEDSRLLKYFKYALYVSGAFLVISIIFRGAITSSIVSGISSSKYLGRIPQEIKEYIASVGANDALVGALLVTAASLLVFFLLKRKISPVVVGIGLLLLTVIDLWRVDNRPMEIISKDQYSSNFQEHDYIQFIKQDNSLYPVSDLTDPNPSNILVSYGLQTPGGYHAAKMREFQDVVDETGNMNGNGIFNPFMWNLLNTKYIIANGALVEDRSRFNPVFVSKEPAQSQNGKQGQPTVVWENPQSLPRAFFAYRYEVKPKLDILHAMHDGTFNPRDVVYLDEAPKDMPALATNPLDTATEKLTMDYKMEDITIHTQTNGNRLLFMSDTWYPDWSATIDGKPTPIYRADYAFRAIAVPQGTHTIQ